MKAHKFYDKKDRGYELYINSDNESIMMAVSSAEGAITSEIYETVFLEFEEKDIDDIIISLSDLKNELLRYK